MADRGRRRRIGPTHRSAAGGPNRRPEGLPGRQFRGQTVNPAAAENEAGAGMRKSIFS